jgi:hypothetical protein
MIKKSGNNPADCGNKRDFSVMGKMGFDLQRHELTNRANRAQD